MNFLTNANHTHTHTCKHGHIRGERVRESTRARASAHITRSMCISVYWRAGIKRKTADTRRCVHMYLFKEAYLLRYIFVKALFSNRSCFGDENMCAIHSFTRSLSRALTLSLSQYHEQKNNQTK